MAVMRLLVLDPTGGALEGRPVHWREVRGRAVEERRHADAASRHITMATSTHIHISVRSMEACQVGTPSTAMHTIEASQSSESGTAWRKLRSLPVYEGWASAEGPHGPTEHRTHHAGEGGTARASGHAATTERRGQERGAGARRAVEGRARTLCGRHDTPQYNPTVNKSVRLRRNRVEHVVL